MYASCRDQLSVSWVHEWLEDDISSMLRCDCVCHHLWSRGLRVPHLMKKQHCNVTSCALLSSTAGSINICLRVDSCWLTSIGSAHCHVSAHWITQRGGTCCGALLPWELRVRNVLMNECDASPTFARRPICSVQVSWVGPPHQRCLHDADHAYDEYISGLSSYWPLINFISSKRRVCQMNFPALNPSAVTGVSLVQPKVLYHQLW